MTDKERGGILLTYNNSAGSGKAVKSAAEAAKILFNLRYPFDLRPFSDLTEEPEMINDWGAVCAFGGDGTIFTAAKMIGESERKPALVPIPAGTENVLARAIHGPNRDHLNLLERTIATLNGEGGSFHRLQLQAGEYRLDKSVPNYFYWLLTLGDSGLTRRTLKALDEQGPQPKLVKQKTALREALRKIEVDNIVLVTVFDEKGERFDEFDALEASIVKRIPGMWSRVPVVPQGHKADQILTIGRGYTDYNSRRMVYRSLADSLSAAVRGGVCEFNPTKGENKLLTRLPISPGHTVVFTAQGEKSFKGTVTDSEVLEGNARKVVIRPNVSDKIIEVFCALNIETA